MQSDIAKLAISEASFCSFKTDICSCYAIFNCNIIQKKRLLYIRHANKGYVAVTHLIHRRSCVSRKTRHHLQIVLLLICEFSFLLRIHKPRTQAGVRFFFEYQDRQQTICQRYHSIQRATIVFQLTTTCALYKTMQITRHNGEFRSVQPCNTHLSDHLFTVEVFSS